VRPTLRDGQEEIPAPERRRRAQSALISQSAGARHRVPALGGPDEDDILRQRLAETERTVDGPSLIAELNEEASHKRRQVGEKRE
jgi:hypothetical protein